MPTATKEMPTRKHVAKDNRPPVAVGHVRIETHDVPETIDFFRTLGMRHIFRSDTFGVLEMRGGTHLVVSGREKPVRKGTAAPFDLMVDDIEAARRQFGKKGFEPSEITSGSVHSSFYLRAPSGHKLKITSSHAGKRAV